MLGRWASLRLWPTTAVHPAVSIGRAAATAVATTPREPALAGVLASRGAPSPATTSEKVPD